MSEVAVPDGVDARPAIDRVVGLPVDGVDEIATLLTEEVVRDQATLEGVTLVAAEDLVVTAVSEQPISAALTKTSSLPPSPET